MRTPLQARRIATIVAAVAASYGAGRLTRSSTTSLTPPPEHEVAEAAREATTTLDAVSRTITTARPRDHRPPGFTPSEYDKTVLAMSDQTLAEFVAHGLHDDVFEQCHSALPKATDATCEGIYQATARVSPKFVDTRKRLLRGEIDASEFQALWHQHFLEREIALEQFMTWDDMLALDGVPPGNDMFMTLNRWGVDAPDDYKIGFENPPEVASATEPGDPP